MTDIIRETVENDQRQSLGTVCTTKTGIPSAPPIPVNSRGWRNFDANYDTTLHHTVASKPSKKRLESNSSPLKGCDTNLHHQPSKRSLRPSKRSRDKGRRQSSGLIVRGSTYYLRLRRFDVVRAVGRLGLPRKLDHFLGPDVLFQVKPRS